MAKQTNVGGKPNEDASLFDLTPEQSRLRAEGATTREAKEYADFLARNSAAAGASGPGSVAGSNAAQVAAPYNLEPGLMSRTLENTYASSRVPGQGGRQGGRNDVDRRQPGKDGRRGGIPFEGGQTYADLRGAGYLGYGRTLPEFTKTPQETQDQETKSPTDPFSSGLTDLQNQRKGLYEEMFANQEQFAQDKFDSIKDYLGTMDAERKEQYQADLANIGMMYNERRQQRDQRFNQALQGTGNRESLALDTLADLGITPNRETFDSATGATKDMLFSQQQSGADLLNNMSFISNQMLEFSNSESGRAIAAGLQQAESSLAEEMANIQFARDSQAISDIEASIAQQKAEAQAAAALRRAQQAEELENQRAITAGAYFGVTDPAEAVALYRTGAMDDIIGAALAPTPQQEATIMVPTQFGEVPMSINQAISSGYIEAPANFGGQPSFYNPSGTDFNLPIETVQDYLKMQEAEALR
tara:strand:- start:26493 stop:27911 length:1419 start_codon:yes stop_codon:yes gene_type:complete